MSSLSEYQTLINNLFDLIGKIKNTRKIITDIFKTNKQTKNISTYDLYFFQILIMIQK